MSIDEALEALELEPTEFNKGQITVFATCLHITSERNRNYGDLWKRYGWLGNLMHVQSKCARLVKMFWEDQKTPQADSSDLDDAYDLINYVAFFIRNAAEYNERGHVR